MAGPACGAKQRAAPRSVAALLVAVTAAAIAVAAASAAGAASPPGVLLPSPSPVARWENPRSQAAAGNVGGGDATDSAWRVRQARPPPAAQPPPRPSLPDASIASGRDDGRHGWSAGDRGANGAAGTKVRAPASTATPARLGGAGAVEVATAAAAPCFGSDNNANELGDDSDDAITGTNNDTSALARLNNSGSTTATTANNRIAVAALRRLRHHMHRTPGKQFGGFAAAVPQGGGWGKHVRDVSTVLPFPAPPPGQAGAWCPLESRRCRPLGAAGRGHGGLPSRSASGDAAAVANGGADDDDDGDVSVFFAMLSVSPAQRRLLRDTWLAPFAHTPFLDYRFFVDAKAFNAREQAGFGDLVVLDSFRANKMYGEIPQLQEAWGWALNHTRADWVVRADTDGLLCVANFINTVLRLPVRIPTVLSGPTVDPINAFNFPVGQFYSDPATLRANLTRHPDQNFLVFNRLALERRVLPMMAKLSAAQAEKAYFTHGWPFLVAGVNTLETSRIVHWHLAPATFAHATRGVNASATDGVSAARRAVREHPPSACEEGIVWLHAVKNPAHRRTNKRMVEVRPGSHMERLWWLLPPAERRPPRTFRRTLVVQQRRASFTTMPCELHCANASGNVYDCDPPDGGRSDRGRGDGVRTSGASSGSCAAAPP